MHSEFSGGEFGVVVELAEKTLAERRVGHKIRVGQIRVGANSVATTSVVFSRCAMVNTPSVPSFEVAGLGWLPLQPRLTLVFSGL